VRAFCLVAAWLNVLIVRAVALQLQKVHIVALRVLDIGKDQPKQLFCFWSIAARIITIVAVIVPWA